MVKPLVLVVALTILAGISANIPLGQFSSGNLAGWEAQTFRGKQLTDYSLVQDEGRTVLRARSNRSASGLIRKGDLDLRHYPVLRWSWKVERSLKGEEVTRKGGDDFAARVYVVFPRTFFWQTRAISYVWAHRMPQGSHTPNPYTANAMLVAVESGDSRAGRWVNEERDVAADYRLLFDEEPPQAGAVAVMTDTDDTGDKVTAWYGDILLGR